MSTLIGRGRFEWGTRVYVMGIVNVTPDSFSGDGLAGRPGEAIEQGQRMVAEGADLLDIGGESTRPGHVGISAEEELGRVLPVIEALAEAALRAGATIVNDIWGLRRAPALADLAARHDAAMVVMHNQEGTQYERGLLPEISASLRESVARAEAAGIPRERIIVDPGLGFGKTAEHNVEILRHLRELTVLGQPLLVGPSRKSFLGKVFGIALEDRLLGTAASVAAAVLRGADIVRVHDVREMRDVVKVAEGLR
jgi:dihydropteroate synthase